MLPSVDLSRSRNVSSEEDNTYSDFLSGTQRYSEPRGREEELGRVLHVLQDARASGLAVRISVEGPTGMGRGAFAAACLRAAHRLGLRTQGPMRCPGREHNFSTLAGLCPACLGGGPWTRVNVGAGPSPDRRPSTDVEFCSASGRMWLRAYPEGAAASRAHPEERVYRVRLEPISHAAVLQMAEDVLGTLPGESLAAYLSRAAGHPTLTRELLLGLWEERSLIYQEGKVDIRIDRLPVRVHTWVEDVLRSVRITVDEFMAACASMGDEFKSLEPARKAMEITERQADEMCRVAIELGLLQAVDTFRFPSPIMHEIFWSNIPRRLPSFIQATNRLATTPGTRVSTENRPDLTAQEKQLVLLASEGFTNRQIAHRLHISQHTVNYHLKKLFRKYGVNSRVRLVRTALKDTALDRMSNALR